MKFTIQVFILFLFSFQLTAQESSTDPINDLIMQGIELHDQNDYKGAIKKYEEALELDKKNFLAHAEIAMSLYASEKYKDAVSYSKKAIKYAKDDDNIASVYITYGNSLDMMNEPKKSIKIYKKGLKENPNNHMLHFNFGVTLSKQNKTEEALKYFQNSTRLNPYHGTSHYAQCLTAQSLGMKTPAILSGWFFLIMEPTGQRAKVIQEGISSLLSSGAKETGDNEITISIDQLLGGEDAENDFMAIEILLGAQTAIEISGEEKELSELENLKLKTQLICSALSNEGGEEKQKGFYWDFYAPFFYDLNEKGFGDTFSHIFSVSKNDKEIDKWLEENGDKVEEFYQWVENYEWE